MAQWTAGPALFAAKLMPKAPVERGLPQAMAELGQAFGANALACLGGSAPGPFVPREDTIQRAPVTRVQASPIRFAAQAQTARRTRAA